MPRNRLISGICPRLSETLATAERRPDLSPNSNEHRHDQYTAPNLHGDGHLDTMATSTHCRLHGSKLLCLEQSIESLQ